MRAFMNHRFFSTPKLQQDLSQLYIPSLRFQGVEIIPLVLIDVPVGAAAEPHKDTLIRKNIQK
ncbi:hypothetical protein D3C86_2211770 [compost metagenome]